MRAATHRRTLFVGNSLTYWKPGLDAIFRDCFGEKAASVVQGGATLQVLWDAGKALAAIQSGEFTHVVLQDDLPEYGRSTGGAYPEFHQHARLFAEAAREGGATPVLLMTHSYERLRYCRLDGIARAHQEVARVLELTVAPAGLVIGYEGLAASTKLGELLTRDKEHPTPLGMLLEALLVRAAILDGGGAKSTTSLEQLEADAQRAIEAGALVGGATHSSTEALAKLLAASAHAGRVWWSTYPARPDG